MIITSARLLAHCCCIYMLLLSVAPTTTASPTRTTTTSSLSPQVARKDKKAVSDLPLKKGKCQYNLTDSSPPLYADSSTYQHLGYTKCEFIIQAPSSQFILINFTDIHLLPDMPVEIGVRHQHHQQAATTTTSFPATTAFTENPLRKHPTDKENSEKSSANGHQPHQSKGDSVSSGKNFGSNTSHSGNLSNDTKCIHNNSVDNKNSGSTASSSTPTDSDKRPVENTNIYKPSSSQGESSPSSEESLKTSRSFTSNNSKDLSQKAKNSASPELSTSSSSELPFIEVEEGGSKKDHPCDFKLIIEGVNSSGGDKQVICWQPSWKTRIPLVYRYSVPIKITYSWKEKWGSGFSLDFRFIQSEGVDCHFRCNSHLCLLQDQICDGFSDCPDQSDENSTACSSARSQQEDGNPHVISVIVIVISVIVAIIIVAVVIVAVVILMISRTRCRNGARQGRDSLLQPPPSSEVCRSTSGSMQDNGQYEALLHDRHHQHPQQQLAALTVMVPSNLKDSQLLRQQQQHQMDQQHHQIHRHHKMNQNHSAAAESTAMLQEDLRSGKSWQHKHHLQQQQQQHKHASKQRNPSELYPPQIPVSGDGEEGFATAQKSLHSKQQSERTWQEQEMFRPPPNLTICDRDSPPPPYSLNPPGAKSLNSLVPPVGVVSVLRPARTSLTPHGSPTGVPRCHSLSCHH